MDKEPRQESRWESGRAGVHLFLWAAAQQDPGFQELHLLGCWDRRSGAQGMIWRGSAGLNGTGRGVRSWGRRPGGRVVTGQGCTEEDGESSM